MASISSTELRHGLTVGDLVRPKGEHIAKDHIGKVVEFTTPYRCPTCGSEWERRVRVRWSDGRIGDWTESALLLVTKDER